MRSVAGVLLAVLFLPGPLRAAEPALLVLETPVVLMESVLDPATGAPCGGEGTLTLRLARPAAVSLRSGDAPLAGAIDGRRVAPVVEVPLEPGRHAIVLGSSTLSSPAGARSIDLEARAAPAGPSARASGLLQGVVINRSVLPVGRTFLTGVDLFDGHLTRQSTDLKVEGRHLTLEVTRTYASSPGNQAGWTGAGWAFTFASRLTAFEACGLFAVTTADGSSQTFRSADGGRTFIPPRGYHTNLRRLGDGSYDFVDKAANRHHFAGLLRGSTHGQRLEYLEEPHGDRVELRYDREGRLREASEVQPEVPGARVLARTLRFSWTTAGGLDRISSMEALGLGVRADYGYDAQGNLIRAIRRDDDTAGPTVESYAYETSPGSLQPRLMSWTAANGAKTEYRYAGPGPTAGYVTNVTEVPPKGGRVVTTIAYDRSRAGAFLATTREGSTAPYVYEMKANGDLARLEETDKQGRRVITMDWSTTDVLKLRESDNRGYQAAWEYDRRGNQIHSRTRARAGAAEVEQVYEYDPTFNKLVRRKDGEGKTSAWTIDPRTGDLLTASEAEGAITRYTYDRRGNLVETRQPDGSRIVYAEHDNFGHATRITRPSGQVETPEFDPRGRRYAEEPKPKPPPPSPRSK